MQAATPGIRMATVHAVHSVALLGVLNQVVAAGVSFAGFGLIARQVPPDQFGLMMTVIAWGAPLSLAHLGQPSLVLTRLSAMADGDGGAARRFLSSSTALVVGVAAAALILLLALGPLAPWGDWLNARSVDPQSIIVPCVLVGLSLPVLTAPTIVAGFSIFAHQRGGIVHLTMSIASLVSFLFLAVCVVLQAPLWLLLGAILSGPLVGGVALWVIGLRHRLVARPAFDLVTVSGVRTCLRLGSLLSLSELATMLIIRTPEIIVANHFGPAAVAQIGSVGRLSLLIFVLYGVVLQPFWPLLARAAERRDRVLYIRLAGQTLTVACGLWLAGVVGLLAGGERLIEIWLGSPHFASPSLIAAACAQTLGLAVLSWGLLLLITLSLQSRQLKITAFSAALFLLVSHLLTGSIGPEGVFWLEGAVLVLCFGPLTVLCVHRELRHMGVAKATVAA